MKSRKDFDYRDDYIEYLRYYYIGQIISVIEPPRHYTEGEKSEEYNRDSYEFWVKKCCRMADEMIEELTT